MVRYRDAWLALCARAQCQRCRRAHATGHVPAVASQVSVSTILLGQNERAAGGTVPVQAEVLVGGAGLVLRLVD